MKDWLEFDYVVASDPGQCVFDALSIAISDRTCVELRWLYLEIDDLDALLIVLDGATGLQKTLHANLFEFTGDRLQLEDWMSECHPSISYRWIEQFAIAFSDPAAQIVLDGNLGTRLLRVLPIPATVCDGQ